MNYDAAFDAEIWAFIRATEAHYAPDASSRSITEQRAQYDALCAAFDKGRPEGVAVEDSTIEAVPVRTYRAEKAREATVIFAHGGGFVLGSLESHDSICAEFCARTGFTVIAVDYRLAPEHKHPAPYEDVLVVAQVMGDRDGGPIVLVGDSAGATLVAAVAHQMRRAISGQLLIYPYLGGDMNAGSYLIHADAPMLSRADMMFFESIRCDGPAPRADPSYLPLQDEWYGDLPPTVVVTADCDPLRDEGQLYCERLIQAGEDAVYINEPGLVHGFLRARHTVDRARKSFDRMVQAIRHLAGPLD